MIPFSVTSQVKYKINGDTIIGFTPYQTRKLAIKLKEGETYKTLYFTNEEIIKYKDSLIYTKDYNIRICDSLLVVNNMALADASNRIIQYDEDIAKVRKQKRTAIWVAIGSIIVNLALISGIAAK